MNWFVICVLLSFSLITDVLFQESSSLPLNDNKKFQTLKLFEKKNRKTKSINYQIFQSIYFSDSTNLSRKLVSTQLFLLCLIDPYVDS